MSQILSLFMAVCLIFISSTSFASDKNGVQVDVESPESRDRFIGFQVGSGSSKETLSNQTGSRAYSYDISSYKLLIGKDFNFWNIDNINSSRLLFGYGLSRLSSGIEIFTLSIGYQENMSYWSIMKGKTYQVYPFASINYGYNYLTGGWSSYDGAGAELDIGLMLEYDYFELSIAYALYHLELKNGTAGVADYMSNQQFVLGANFKF